MLQTFHPSTDTQAAGDKHPFLLALGERVRNLRSRRGMTRKSLALSAEVSERHLANMEYGVGNASVLVLLQVARALRCSLGELIGDVTTSSPEWLLIRELLEGRSQIVLEQLSILVIAGELLQQDGCLINGQLVIGHDAIPLCLRRQ